MVRKNNSRILIFRDEMENIPLPPIPVITRWKNIDSHCFILRRIFYKIPKGN